MTERALSSSSSSSSALNTLANQPVVDYFSPTEELRSYLQEIEEFTHVHSFGSGIEIESAGRAINKGAIVLREDLSMLPFVLASKNDIVLTRIPRPEFLQQLTDRLGLVDFPLFVTDMEAAQACGRPIAGVRPFGVAGEHMRRSNIAKYRDDVAVCVTMEQIEAAVLLHGPKVVIKSEYSSGGQGIRWRWDEATKGWAQNRLRQDGCVTVEPFFEIVTEVSGEFLYGRWNGCSMVIVEYGMWRGQWLGDPRAIMSEEVYDFIYIQRQVEKTMVALNVPERCGFETCGMDIAIIRDGEGKLCVRLLELNARVNMAHYALAVKRRVPSALRFNVVRVGDVARNPNLIPLTDPEEASTWCAVVELATKTPNL